MSSNSVLSDRDVNAPISGEAHDDNKAEPKSLEYHRQMLHSKLNGDKSTHQYVSPSDGIMSPCTAKLSAYRNKHFMKAKPQSLFGKPKPKPDNTSSPFGMSSTENEPKDGAMESGTDESSAVPSKESSPGPQGGL